MLEVYVSGATELLEQLLWTDLNATKTKSIAIRSNSGVDCMLVRENATEKSLYSNANQPCVEDTEPRVRSFVKSSIPPRNSLVPSTDCLVFPP